MFLRNMVNKPLIFLLESTLGKGKPTSRGNYAFHCPKCNHRKLKLEINLDEKSSNYQKYNCWVCTDFEGKTIKSLFKKLKIPQNKIDELDSLIKPTITTLDHKDEQIVLPKEFVSLVKISTNLMYKKAIGYIKNRGLNNYDILRHNIGYCLDGKYSDRIIIPSYDEYGVLNYFIARSFNENQSAYQNPKISKDIIFNGFFINWNLPIIICEGVFDALAIKRNVIPLLGKTINEALMKKIVTSQVKKIYLALDSDAMKATLKHAEKLLELGKEIYLIELKDKDPSILGFEKFTELIQQVQSLTFSELIKKKLELC